MERAISFGLKGNNFSFVVIVEPPPVVEFLLASDKTNTFCNRLVASNI